MEDINPKFLDVEPLQIRPNIVRLHGLNPGGSRINGNNSFLIGTGDKRVLIDCGACDDNEEQSQKFVDSVISYLKDHSLSLSHILITHYHYDHLGGVPAMVDALERMGVNTKEDLIVAKKLHKHSMEDKIWEQVKDRCKIQNLEDGDTIEVESGETITALYTPGHCEDHM